MNDDSISKISSNSYISDKIEEYRCSKCSLIPFIYITFDENKLL